MPISPDEAYSLRSLFLILDLELIAKTPPVKIEIPDKFKKNIDLIVEFYRKEKWGVRKKDNELEFFIPSSGGTNYKD